MQFRRKIAAPIIVSSMGVLVGIGADPGISPVSAAVGGGPVLALSESNSLIAFDVATPGTITQTTAISGLQPGESIVGFDIRPATGELFAVGVTGATGRMYVINRTSGAATQVGAQPFSTTLPAGGTWSVDFNPTVDRIRFVHSGGVSLRLNPLNGALGATDTPVAPAKPSALAYDRSTAITPMATTLFAIDDVANTLNRIGGVDGMPSPNLGATTAIGALGVDPAVDSVAFDIAPQGDALATLQVGGTTGLYTVNLNSGAATFVGAVGAGNIPVRDIALPRPPSASMFALGPDNALHSFNAASPGVVSTQTISGVQIGEDVVGIDVRPATGEVFAISFAGTSGRVLRIDPATAAATQIGAPFTVPAVSDTWSVDFNPTVDRIRLIGSNGDSFRLNPNNGVLAFTDTDVAPATPSAVAYDRPVATTAATTLFAIDTDADTLNLIGGVDAMPSPNLGATTVRGPLGVSTDSDLAGFDISPVGDGIAALSVSGSTGLYTVDLASGSVELIGLIADGSPEILDVAVAAVFPAGAAQFTPVTPTRLIDSRTGAKPAAGDTVDVQVTGVAGVPANATAVVLNTTGTEASLDGYVTVYPAGEDRPVVSNHNLTTGQTRANLVTVKLGDGGKVSFFTQSGTHLIADVLGYYAPATGVAGRFNALTPARVMDTRESGGTLAPMGSIDVPVLGLGGVPASGVSAVLVNLAGTEANAPGYITAHAAGSERPGTSNLNLEQGGSTASNLAIVPVGVDGEITVFSQSGADIVVDVAGWYGDDTAKGGYSGLYVPVSPTRVLDTREGLGAAAGPVAITGSIDVTLAGVGGVPMFGASSVLINLTAVEATQAGFVTVYPAGQPKPFIASLNVDRAGQTTPNLVGATLGAMGMVTMFDHAGGHLVADVSGWFTR